MTAVQLLNSLEKQGATLWEDEGRLRYRVPKGVMNEDLLSEITDKKHEIISILRNRKKDFASTLPQIIPDPQQLHQPFPLTDIQHAYWIGRIGALELGNVACHAYSEIDHEELDLDRYVLAWQRLIERHDMLRAVFLSDGRQQILEHVPPYRIEVLDLRGQALDVVEFQLEAVRQRMSHQVLKTDQWPLFEIRASLIDDKRTRIHISLDLLIADYHSIEILLRELFQLYQNPDVSLVPLELSFRDYVLAETTLLDSEMYQRNREYWMKRLPTLPPAPDLPLAKNPGDVISPRFGRHTFRLEPKTRLRLKNRASQAGLTPSGLLIAAYAEILSVWSKSLHFTINLTLFNRFPVHPQVNDIVGDFTSLAMLEVENSSQDAFEVRAQRLQRQFWNDMDHRYFSGVRVLREVVRSGRRALAATMPVVFTGNISSHEDQSFNVLENLVYNISQTPQVWLDNQVYEDAGALVILWDAVEELFPEGLLDDMFDAYCRLLKRLADEEDAWQETTRQLIPAAQLEKRALFNATEAPISSEMLHTLFVAQARRRAKQAAVVSSKRTLSYEELSNRSNQAGRLLQEKGAQPNTLVAVVMEKGWEQVVAVLGILQSGAAYLPIDPELPRERLWHLLGDGQVNLILTQSWLNEKLEWPDGIQRFSVDIQELSQENAHPLNPAQRPEDLAYVIYTSGSTGLPKGVMIDHRGAVNTILDVNKRFGVEPEDRVLALANLNFDLSVYDIFGTLAAGGTIVLPEADKTKDPAHWLELMIQEQVTVWNTVPALMQMLVEYASGRKDVVSQSLRLVLLSGDWIPLDLPDQIKALVEGVQVISLGGATEASIWSNLYPIEQVDPNWKSIPYGRPMVNQRFYVLNEFLEDCPDWVPGQLYIGGIGLALGYWHDEEKTLDSFIIHPRTKERLYRTGDLGRYLPDGNIEFLGRQDFQVKIRGYRIELGEIEATLKQHPGVRDAVVTAVGDSQGDKRLVGYVVFDQELPPATDELRGFLREKLPEYMVPSAFVMLDALPLTPNGKVDRKALPMPDEVRSERERTFVAPQTQLEASLAEIWTQVLNINRVGIHDNFFELGGDSLLATKFVLRIREAFKVELPLPRFFESPTVAELSQVIDALHISGPTSVMDTISVTDLNAEAILDTAISPEGIPIEHVAEQGYIFLTGATGFLGGFLLHELLQQTQADIYCLVRSSNEEEAEGKLQRNLGSYSLWDESLRSRIIPVVGDLSQPLFGLSVQQFRKLASQIDTIYHCGAWVHYIYSYSTLKATNVLGTQEVLRLASQIKVKPVHYISTTSVFSPIGQSEAKVIREDDDLVYNGSLYGGYPQSKWVAEKLVTIARSRGLPVCIYRPGMITGHSCTGIWNTDDFVCRLIKGCIQIGSVPELNRNECLVPVDCVSKAIIYLSSQNESLGKAFHLINSNPITIGYLVNCMRSFGYSLRHIPYDQWRQRLTNDTKSSQENALYPLLPVLPDRINEDQVSIQLLFDNQNTIKGLANTDIVLPPVDEGLLSTYFSYFIRSGFLDVPQTDEPHVHFGANCV